MDEPTKRLKISPWVMLTIGLAALYLIVDNTTFNPFGRFFETPPNVYRNLSNVLELTGSPQLRGQIRQALERDGKLTQANIKPVWQAWEKALPTGYRVSQDGVQVQLRSVERQRLIEQVGAVPSKTVWTPFTE